jgi:hypothetical protein
LNVADFLPQASTTGPTTQGHEANTLVVKGLIAFAVVLVAVGIVVEFGLVFVMRDFTKEEKVLQALAPPKFADDPGPFPAPRLQAEPPADFAKLKAEELRRLNGYGWVDRKAGIAHIPIDRAIEIVSSSGLPATQPATVPGKPAQAGAAKERKP